MSQKICNKCQRPMVRRKSAKGEFWGCSGYPECKNIENIENSAQEAPKHKLDLSTSYNVVLNRAEKPHSFEFGKPGNRHKIYYSEIKELKAHIDALVEAGLAEPMGLNEEVKPEDFEG